MIDIFPLSTSANHAKKPHPPPTADPVISSPSGHSKSQISHLQFLLYSGTSPFHMYIYCFSVYTYAMLLCKVYFSKQFLFQ